MIKRFLFLITILSFGFIPAANAHAQDGKAKTSRTSKRYKKVREFSSTTQPHADGLILERRSSGRKKKTSARRRVTKPVRRLQTENGGLDTADETPEFGEANRKPGPKKPQNLLPYMEQSNLRRRPAGGTKKQDAFDLSVFRTRKPTKRKRSR